MGRVCPADTVSYRGFWYLGIAGDFLTDRVGCRACSALGSLIRNTPACRNVLGH